jgi:ATP-dependent DNA ligase
MVLPVRPPLAPMLAKLQDEIPRGEGWVYEPKWDGFRAIVFRDGEEVTIMSRDHKPLHRYFPELLPALRAALPEACVLDGEVIMPGPDGRLEFDALQLRLHPAESRIRKLAAEMPATFVVFDLIAVDGEDLRERPFSERRQRLERLVDLPQRMPSGGDTAVLLTEQTPDPEQAAAWFDELERFGLDGIIAKRSDGPYVPGQRVMVKVKHRRTADCVVGGYRLSKSGDGIGSLLLGLYDGAGVLHFVGHTSSFRAGERREILQILRGLEEKEAFGRGRTPGEPSRWSQGKDLSWFSVEPRLVCEVAFDHMQGNRFRHGATFLRWRTDKRPEECTFDQVRG